MPYNIQIIRKKNELPEATLNSPRDVDSYARKNVFKEEDAWRESCYMITTGKHGEVHGIFLMSAGTHDRTVFDAKLAAQVAVLDNADGAILVHNHPDGNPRPSACDIHVTQNIKRALNAVSVDLRDHVIIGNDGYYSFNEEIYKKR